MFFTSAEVMSENLWQITSRATKKSLFVVTSVSFYFLYAISCLEHTILLKTIMDHSFHHCSQGRTFLTCDIITLGLWCHANMMWFLTIRYSRLSVQEFAIIHRGSYHLHVFASLDGAFVFDRGFKEGVYTNRLVCKVYCINFRPIPHYFDLVGTNFYPYF